MSKFAKLEGQEAVVESVLRPVEEGWKIILAKIANAIGIHGPLEKQEQKATSYGASIFTNPAVIKWIDQEAKTANKEIQEWCKREVEYYKKQYPIEASQQSKLSLTATQYTSDTELIRDLQNLGSMNIFSTAKKIKPVKFKEKHGSFQHYVKCGKHLLCVATSADTIYRVALNFKISGVVGDDDAEFVGFWNIDPPSDAELKKIIGDIH